MMAAPVQPKIWATRLSLAKTAVRKATSPASIKRNSTLLFSNHRRSFEYIPLKTKTRNTATSNSSRPLQSLFVRVLPNSFMNSIPMIIPPRTADWNLFSRFLLLPTKVILVPHLSTSVALSQRSSVSDNSQSSSRNYNPLDDCCFRVSFQKLYQQQSDRGACSDLEAISERVNSIPSSHFETTLCKRVLLSSEGVEGNNNENGVTAFAYSAPVSFALGLPSFD